MTDTKSKESTFKILTDEVKRLFDDKIEWGIRKVDLEGKRTPPSLVWVNLGGVITKPLMSQHIGAYEYGGKKYYAKHIHDNIISVEVHIHTEDNESWERMHNRVLSAVHQVFGTASEPGQHYMDTEAGKSGHSVRGAYGRQMFEWRLRVCQFKTNIKTELGPYVPMKALVTILNQTHNCTLHPASFSGSLEV